MDHSGAVQLRPGAHLMSLTSLRFFAAAVVVLLHIGQKAPPFPGARDLFGLGHVGVTFFFVLSGFVLAWSHRAGDTARVFYQRRFARVWPLHISMTVLAAILVLAAGSQPRWWALPFVGTLTHAFVPGAYYAFNTPSWSLGCEAFFYALFPALIVVAARSRRPVLWALILAGAYAGIATAVTFVVAPAVESAAGISASGIVGYGLNIFPGYRILEFAIGVLLATAVRRGWRCPLSLAGAVALVGAVWLGLEVVGLVVTDGAHRIAPYWASAALLLPLAALVASAATADVNLRQSTLLHDPRLVRLGQASFALYLVHVLVLTEVVLRLGVAPNWVLAVVGAGIALVLAEVAHRFIETPANQRFRPRGGPRLVSA